jgi:Cft2 family RNA processing exonuclease
MRCFIPTLSYLISWGMEGRLIPCGPESYFGVDFWRHCPDKTVLAYFLTHFHTDHIQGLRQNWNLGPLYCSDGTCELLRRRWPTFPGSIHILEVGVPLVIRVSHDIQIQVTPLHAEHCLVSAIIKLNLKTPFNALRFLLHGHSEQFQ